MKKMSYSRAVRIKRRIVTLCAGAIVGIVGVAGLGGSVGAQTPEPAVDIQHSCLAGRGRVDVTVPVADDGSAHEVSVTVGRLAPRTRTVDAGASTRITVTGRPDGALGVAARIDGAVVRDETITIACAPVLSAPVVETSCMASRGRVDVSVPTDSDYTVSFPGLADRVVKAGTAGRVTWTGRPDGTYNIVAKSGDGTTTSLEAAVDCARKGSSETGMTTPDSCPELADDLRGRALDLMAPLNLDASYYDLAVEQPWYAPVPVATALDALDDALPEQRTGEADIAAFAPDRAFYTAFGYQSNPSGHPDSVAVLAVDDGVIIIDQRSRDVVLTRYDATGETAKAKLRVDGAYIRARLVDGVVQLVTQAAPNLAGTDAASIEATKTMDWVPRYTWTAPSGSTDTQILTPCADIAVPNDFAGFSVMSLTSLDPQTLKPTPGVGVVADEAMILVDDDRALVATHPWSPPRQAGSRPLTEEAYATSIYDFGLSDPSRAKYQASGSVQGELMALDVLADGRIAVAACELWSTSAAPNCTVSTLEKVADTLRASSTAATIGQRAEAVRVRFGGDVAVIQKGFRAKFLVDLSEPGAFPQGDLGGTSSRWNAFRLSEDRLLFKDGNQLVLLDISDMQNPAPLARFGDPDPAPSGDLYWRITYFDDSFSWDPSSGTFFIGLQSTSVNDPYHPGGYTTELGREFTISDTEIQPGGVFGGNRTFDSELSWRSLIDGDEIRIVVPGLQEIRRPVTGAN